MEELFGTLPALLDQFPDNQAVVEAVVFAAWKRTAGGPLADHAVALSLDERRLRIGVPSEMWRRHLEDLSGQMLFRLNSILGSPSVIFIEFVVLTADEEAIYSAQPRRDDSSIFEAEAAAEITAEIQLAAGQIADRALRATFLAAAGNCLTRMRRLAETEAGGQI